MSTQASRRAVVRSMAWSVPAVAVVAAAPAYAASTAAFSVAASRVNPPGRNNDNTLQLVISSSPTGVAISSISVFYRGQTRAGTPTSGTTSVQWLSTQSGFTGAPTAGTVSFIAGGSTVTLNFSA